MLLAARRPPRWRSPPTAPGPTDASQVNAAPPACRRASRQRRRASTRPGPRLTPPARRAHSLPPAGCRAAGGEHRRLRARSPPQTLRVRRPAGRYFCCGQGRAPSWPPPTWLRRATRRRPRSRRVLNDACAAPSKTPPSPGWWTALRAATAAAVRQHSECVLNSTVLLSMVNEHQARSAASLTLVGNLSCLMCRFVSLCWEGDYADGFGACVKGRPRRPRSSRAVPYGDVGEVVRRGWALGAADAALFADADVVLLRNPFADAEVLARKRRCSARARTTARPTRRPARSTPGRCCCATADGRGGARGDAGALRRHDAARAGDRRRRAPRRRLRGEVAAAALRHCWFGRSGLSLRELTTYHAHCRVGTTRSSQTGGRPDSAGLSSAPTTGQTAGSNAAHGRAGGLHGDKTCGEALGTYAGDWRGDMMECPWNDRVHCSGCASAGPPRPTPAAAAAAAGA